MKIRLELEVSPEEAGRVAPLLEAFQQLSDSLSKRPATPRVQSQASSPVAPRTKPKRPHDAFLSASLSEQTPSEASAQLLAGGFSQAEIADAAISVLCDPTKAGSSSTRATAVVTTVQNCGDGVLKVFKQGFVGRAVRELVLPRAHNCPRDAFMGFAEGLVALAGIGQVSGEAVLRTVRRLLDDDECWAAGVTLLCLVLERGRIKGEMTEIRRMLGDLARVEEFRYDIEYISSVTGWKIGEG